MSHAGGTTFYIPPHASEQDSQSVLATALKWAEEHGYSVVYVQD